MKESKITKPKGKSLNKKKKQETFNCNKRFTICNQKLIPTQRMSSCSFGIKRMEEKQKVEILQKACQIIQKEYRHRIEIEYEICDSYLLCWCHYNPLIEKE